MKSFSSCRVLVVGLGSIGERHIINLLSIGVNDIAVLRRKISEARTFDINLITQFDNLDDALNWKPEFLIICTPSIYHFEDIKFWSDFCKDILVEVPLNSSSQGFDFIQKKITKNKVNILIGHNIRFHPALQCIKSIIKDQSFGKLLFSRSEFGEYLPDCHPWEDYRKRYEARSDLGGGVALTSIHEIDHAVWLCGRVTHVSGVVRNLTLDIDGEDIALIILEHESGALSQINLDFFQRKYMRSLKLAFEDGIIEWGLKANSVQAFNAKKKNKNWYSFLNTKGYDFNQTYIDQLKLFLSRADIKWNNFESGLHILKVVEALKESSSTGKRVSVI